MQDVYRGTPAYNIQNSESGVHYHLVSNYRNWDIYILIMESTTEMTPYSQFFKSSVRDNEVGEV